MQYLKSQNHTRALHQSRKDGEEEEAGDVGINVHACLCVCTHGRMWGFSAIGELIQRICSASRGERRLIGIECAPHLQRDTHTTQASVSLTYRWVFEHPLVQNQSSNNKLHWLFWFVVTNALCSLVSGNACCKGFHSLDFTRVCDSVWLCVHNASQSTCTHRFAINNVYLRHVDWTKVTAEEGIRKQRNLLGGRKKTSIYLFKLLCLCFN